MDELRGCCVGCVRDHAAPVGVEAAREFVGDGFARFHLDGILGVPGVVGEEVEFPPGVRTLNPRRR